MNAPTRPQNPRAAIPPRGKPPRKTRLTAGMVTGLALILALPFAAIYRGLPPLGCRWAFGYGLLISGLTFVLYARDKKQAAIGGWRTPESALHLAELAGGWAAAFLAQRLYRHKVVKTRYQISFWAIVLAYQYAAGDWLLDGKLSRGAISYFRG